MFVEFPEERHETAVFCRFVGLLEYHVHYVASQGSITFELRFGKKLIQRGFLRERSMSLLVPVSYTHLDGGHFENLGLYELIRRKCRYIIVSDGEQDESYVFESLGGAIRKARIDFGARCV